MKKKWFTAEQIIRKLRPVAILLGQGRTVGKVSRKLGITEQTDCRWGREYGGGNERKGVRNWLKKTG